jgi:hypothetical protein
MATGINLATNLSIPKEGPTRANQNFVVVEMFSSNLISTGAAWVLDFSVSGEHFDHADEGGTVVSGTLAANDTTVVSFETKPGMFWVLNFTSGVGSTGTVAYSILN